MRELALNILDIAENSLSAGAKLVEIGVSADFAADRMVIRIRDDGCGMDKEMLARVTDPFTTTRTTRKVGMGVPLFKFSAESAGGRFGIRSEKGKGTEVTAEYVISHVDRMPLGDISSTVHTLIVFNEHIDFRYTYEYADRSFTLDTREMREMLGEEISFSEPEVSAFIKEYLEANKAETDGGADV